MKLYGLRNPIKVKKANKTIRCQNCDAILAEKNGRETHIHLLKERIIFKEIEGGTLTTLKCYCGCVTEYKD